MNTLIHTHTHKHSYIQFNEGNTGSIVKVKNAFIWSVIFLFVQTALVRVYSAFVFLSIGLIMSILCRRMFNSSS